ncbi:tetratricopeptide repeat protein [Phormidesmis priestleyi ULC007]|uniref:Tetratricopeptide repeat protein n=1 Tax=Phormidesmis priestleyi ULC007 TaxID=1920490 RepID=A0A2T1DBB0_9CYAN|nr:tetratricopeptide repeat protein [Phormidesmis priestleyi]PSB17756.1 tetratricopeptide repeat protein [Phormidesmis priestleyi ULC007]PZO48698.1 MAG: tetratricopeptide repeat protein [Phormidesmis priestleyi]
MSKQTFTTLDYETPQDSGVLSASPMLGGSIVLILLSGVVGWQVIRQRRSLKVTQGLGSQKSTENAADIPPRFTQALQWIAYAKEQERSQHYEAAIATYNRGLSDHPDDFRLWHERGLALAKLQRFEAAITSYDRAYALQPKQRDLAHERGDALLQLERYEEAIASLDTFLRYNPGNAHVLTDRGYAYCQLDRPEEALQSFNQVLTTERRDRNSLIRARYYQIEALRQLRQFEAALRSSQEAMKQHSEEFFKTQHDALRRQIADD